MLLKPISYYTLKLIALDQLENNKYSLISVWFQVQQATTNERSTMWFMGGYWFMVLLS
jgi:hypothetical protein